MEWCPSNYNHRQNLPTKRKNCFKCFLSDRFANTCKEPKGTPPQTQPLQKTNVSQIEATQEKYDDGESVYYINSYREQYDLVCDSQYDCDSDNCIASISGEKANKLEPLDTKIHIVNICLISLTESCSASCIITKYLAKEILKTKRTSQCTSKKTKKT